MTGEILLSGNADQFGSGELEQQLVDGLKFDFDNDEIPEISSVDWSGRSNLSVTTTSEPQVRTPIDFEIRFFENFADTSYAPFINFQMRQS